MKLYWRKQILVLKKFNRQPIWNYWSHELTNEDKYITIFAKTDMKTVYYVGLSDEQFFTMAQQMICVLNCFASNGSGWVLEKIISLELKVVTFNPSRGSYYLALPSQLLNNRNLLNISNRDDSKYFPYCYTATYHMNFGPTQKSNSWRLITSPALYNSTNVSAHQPQGEFEMPMAVDNIDSFELFEQVNVNFLQYL